MLQGKRDFAEGMKITDPEMGEIIQVSSVSP